MSDEEFYPNQEQLNHDIVDKLYEIFPTRVIVAGSRTCNNYPEFRTILQSYLKDLTGNVLLYSGMAPRGADQLAIEYCKETKQKYYPFPANWDLYGRGAGMVRNRVMTDTATHLIAFYDGKSRGTKDMIEVAEKKGLKVTVVVVKPDESLDVKLYTIQMGQWRVADKLGVRLIDVTMKSGIQPFAPEARFVHAYKNGEMSEEDYTLQYNLKMANSRVNNKKYWDHLVSMALARRQLAFACYCRAGEFCHRRLFIKMVSEYLEKNEVDCTIVGELK